MTLSNLVDSLDLLSCDLPTPKDRATEHSLHDRNKIANEKQINNYDIRIDHDRDVCTYVIM